MTVSMPSRRRDWAQQVTARRRGRFKRFVKSNERLIAEIQAALKEAEAGDFASDEDVDAMATKWQVNAR